MTTDQWIGLVGGLGGAAIGVAGAIWGTRNSLRKTEGPQEHAFVKGAGTWCWVLCLAFVAGVLLIPKPWGWLLWLLYGPALFFGIQAMNAGQARARSADNNGAEH